MPMWSPSPRRIAGALVAGGRPGGKVAILSANDRSPSPASSVSPARARCGVSDQSAQRGRGKPGLLDLFDVEVVIFQAAFAPLVTTDPARTCRTSIRGSAWTGRSRTRWGGRTSWRQVPTLPSTRPMPTTLPRSSAPAARRGAEGRHAHRPQPRTMSALTLVGYPLPRPPGLSRPRPLTHAAGVLCFPVLALGGRSSSCAHPTSTASSPISRATG